MADKYRGELLALKKSVREFSCFSTGMLTDALVALRDQDTVLADTVNDRKKRLAGWSNEIEEQSLRLVALYQPMGDDLRTIACINQMNTSLFRIGRYGKDIAIIVEELSDTTHLKNLKSVWHMADLVEGMIRDVLDSFDTWDLTAIENLSLRDSSVDNLRYSIFRENLTYMMEDPRNITRCIDYVMVSRYLERCGDHACMMGEKVIFMVTGKRVEIK